MLGSRAPPAHTHFHDLSALRSVRNNQFLSLSKALACPLLWPSPLLPVRLSSVCSIQVCVAAIPALVGLFHKKKQKSK